MYIFPVLNPESINKKTLFFVELNKFKEDNYECKNINKGFIFI